MNYEQQLLDNLAFIDEVIGAITRRHRLAKVEGDEFAGFVRLKLVEDDYRVLRKFQHRSRLETYLFAVIHQLYSMYRNNEWGRWRPSKQARRLGPLALLLERLVLRDGHPLEEAIQILRITHRVEASEAALRELWERLPPRRPRGSDRADPGQPGEAVDPEGSALDRADRDERARRIAAALDRGARRLDARDRTIVRLHVMEGVPLLQLAKVQGVHESAMRRRWMKICGTFREVFSEAGLDRSDVEAVLERGTISLPEDFLQERADGSRSDGSLKERDEE